MNTLLTIQSSIRQRSKEGRKEIYEGKEIKGRIKTKEPTDESKNTKQNKGHELNTSNKQTDK